MRRLLPFFLSAVSALAAPASGDSPRENAFRKLSDSARTETLIAQSSEEMKDHRYQRALEHADAALALDPANPNALNTRGAALTELRRFAEAEKALAAAVAAAPDAFPPQFNQGEVLFLQKKYAEAATHFENLVVRFGATPILKYKLYFCYALAGNRDQAAEHFDAMRYPGDGSAWYFAHALALLQSGKPAEAKKLIAAAEAIDHDDAATYRDSLVEAGLLK